VALARVERLTFAYPGAAAPALRDVSLALEPGETVAVLGPSGSGKSTLVRALAGLVPHFHGGRFEGRVEVAGLDTRRHRPAELAGRVASVFQDPEEQVVLTGVEAEVAFGLENLGTPPPLIVPRAREALAAVGTLHLAARPVTQLSAGELQRVCLASALALEPELLLLDEPTSQLDPEAAEAFLELALGLGIAVVCSEQRPAGVLARCDRVLFLEGGELVLDAPRDEALAWLARYRPAYLPREPLLPSNTVLLGGGDARGEVACRIEGVRFAYAGGPPVLDGAELELRRGEIVALLGPNGVGKTTLGKLAAGLLEPAAGRVERRGRACYLLQDPGRYLVRERADDEVALAVGGDRARAAAALAAVGLAGREAVHPRDFSTGERERLALAAVLVAEPDLLVLDEPTRGVDPERKDELAELLRAQAAGRATLVITHELVFAGLVADRVVSLGPDREAVAA
jgi:energy-coupling factor transport system ATP-binding protein